MRNRLLGLLFAVFLLPVLPVLAQQTGTVSGVVLDEDTSDPLPGASVVIRPDNPLAGAATNADGRFVIENVPVGNYTLRVSFIGFATYSQDITVRAGETTSLTINLGPDDVRLDDVVVTALGFTDSRDEQASATSSVSGSQLAQSGEVSVIKALSAKAPGLNVISTGGDPGSGARITIRGQSTIQGDNEPLVVVDGIPVSNSTIGAGTAGVQQQSRLNDINPADIESVEVLKGAAAAALWGSRAQAGVIVIKTKSGQGFGRKVNVSYNSSISVDEINKTVPLQEVYGHGFNGLYQFGSTGFSWGDYIPNRAGGPDEVLDCATCPFAEGLQTGRRYYEIPDGTFENPHGGARSQEVFDHGREIFDTGMLFENTLSISGGDQNGRYYLSLGNVAQDGIIRENSTYNRTTVRLNAERSISSKLSVGAIGNYVRMNSDRVQQGSNLSGLLLGSLRTAADFDNTDYLVNYYENGEGGGFIPGRHRSYRNPLGEREGPIYDNPFFTMNRNINTSLVNRLQGKVSASYDPVNWFNLTSRVGLDSYEDRRQIFFPIYNATDGNGAATEADISEFEITADVIGRATTDITSGIGASLLGGVSLNHREFDQLQGSIVDFSNPIDLRSLSNAEAANISAVTGQSVRRTFGVFGEIDLDFYDQFFLKATGRLDNASTFGPEADNTFFYPSVQAAWQFSDLLPESNFFSFGKLRANFAEVGREPAPYLAFTYFIPATFFDGFTGTTLEATGYGGGFERSARLASPGITPERKQEFEVGIDLRFLADRFSFSGTYYDNTSDDLIFNVDVAPSTGFLVQTQNAAKMENKGIELSAEADWLRLGDFSWSTFANWWTNDNTVVDLLGVQEVGLNGFVSASSSIVEGQPFGVIYGNRWRRAPQGCTEDSVVLNCEPLSQGEIDAGFTVAADGRVLSASGFPMSAANQGVIGDPTPDWKAGLGNTFRYKNVALDVLFDFRVGGEVWNGTKGALYFFGRHEDQSWRTTISADEATTLTNFFGCTVAEVAQNACGGTGGAGVATDNGDGTYTFRGYVEDFGGGPVIVDETYFYSGPGSGFTGPAEPFIEDGSYVRLREVTLAYNWRKGFVQRAGLSSVDFALTGRNLWLSTDYTGIDPETNLTGPSNGQGLDYFNNPQTRSYRFSVRFNY